MNAQAAAIHPRNTPVRRNGSVCLRKNQAKTDFLIETQDGGRLRREAILVKIKNLVKIQSVGPTEACVGRSENFVTGALAALRLPLGGKRHVGRVDLKGLHAGIS